MSAGASTTIKVSVEHNISSMKCIEVRFDLNHTILAVKESMELRYGSVLSYMRLYLKDTKGNTLAEMLNDNQTLGSYGAETGLIIFVEDLNPTSIHKQIESLDGVEKYTISEEDYEKLPENFRKWKKELIKQNPNLIQNNAGGVLTADTDPDYMSEMASALTVGSRVRLHNGARGQIMFIGRIMDLGAGFYVGVRLDEPYGTQDGTVNGVKYFDAENKFGTFVRPDAVEQGDFPVLNIDDEI